jgi:hypothetical protein
VAAIERDADGIVGQPPLRQTGDLDGDLDVSAFAGVPRHASGHEVAGRPLLLARSNQLIGHGWPYSPPEAGEPGWRFYAAAVFDDHNPWWIVMPEVTKYLQRISFLLRQGKPVNDVALFLTTADNMAQYQAGRERIGGGGGGEMGSNVEAQVLDAGFNFDFIDDEAIAQVGVPYPVLILPNVERMPLATLRKIQAYAEAAAR